MIERVEVGARDVEALVRVCDPTWLRTSFAPGFAERALALLPGLARHTCESGSAHGIRAELAYHLLKEKGYDVRFLPSEITIIDSGEFTID